MTILSSVEAMKFSVNLENNLAQKPALKCRSRSSPRISFGSLVPFLVTLVFVTAVCGCKKAGELSKPSKFTMPSGPVELKQHWRAGERIVKSFDMKMTMEISVPGRPDPIKPDMNFRQQWAITVLKENVDGSHEGEMELLKLWLKVQDGKDVFEFDSEHKPSNPQNPTVATLENALANVTGAKVQFLLNPSNRLERIDGVEAIRNRFPAGANNAVEGIKNMFNEGYLRQMIGDSYGLPSNAVQPGDTWPVHMDLPAGEMGTVSADYDFTLQGWEKRGERLCARLEFQGTLKAKGGADPNTKPAGFGGPVSGTSWFDPELGLVIEANVNQDLAMAMTRSWVAQGKKMDFTTTIQMHQVIAIKLDSVTSNGPGAIAEK